jgi:hypothetical protein
MTIARRARLALWAGVGVVALGVGLGLGLSSGGTAGLGTGPEGVPLVAAPDLASANTTAPGLPVDGITCRPITDQHIAYHIHIHVAIWVRGRQYRLPAGLGITRPRLVEHFPTGRFDDVGLHDCIYWLHVHTDDDIVHVESPGPRHFVLGEVFDIWRQPLGFDQVGPAHGRVEVFVDGRPFHGNPRDVPLRPHEVVQLDVGPPFAPFHPVHFHVTELCAAGSSCVITPTTSPSGQHGRPRH